MPIYEYRCCECDTDFEKLLFGNQEVTCPKCNSNDVKKKFSVFCSSGTEKPLAGTSAAGSGCSSCSKTSCSSCR
jgi:putative FmdB family regulatory protein